MTTPFGILSPVEPSDVHKTAVTTPFGLFNFTRTTFGLRNSGQTFQRFIDHLTCSLDFVLVCLDDLLVTSPDHATHEKHLKKLFTRLAEYRIIIGPQKCQFGMTELGFLCLFGGHLPPATDRGAQFESRLWDNLCNQFGIIRNRTASYHPQSNGMVKRFHRQLKTAIMAHEPWKTTLPAVLLCIRSAVKELLDRSAV